MNNPLFCLSLIALRVVSSSSTHSKCFKASSASTLRFSPRCTAVPCSAPLVWRQPSAPSGALLARNCSAFDHAFLHDLVLRPTKSGHWFRFIRPLRLPSVFCIRCSCVAADGCSNPSDSAARPPHPVLGWYSRAPASTPFSGF